MFTAIAVFGPPGSGKGTQAENLAEGFDLDHVDTGRLIEQTVHNTSLVGDPVVDRERENFDSGKLCTPEWVTGLIINAVRTKGEQKRGIVFSGSPRTRHEAEQVLPVLEKTYGKQNLLFFKLDVSEEVTTFRNIHRRVCEDCGNSLVYSEDTIDITECDRCSGKIIVRTLDTAEAMKVRIDEYKNRTAPVLDFIEQSGYEIVKIDGEPAPDVVKESIKSKMRPLI